MADNTVPIKKKKQVKITKSAPAPNALPTDISALMSNFLSNPAMLQTAMRDMVPQQHQSDPKFQEMMKNPQSAIDLIKQKQFGWMDFGTEGLSQMVSGMMLGNQGAKEEVSEPSANDNLLDDLTKGLESEKQETQTAEDKKSNPSKATPVTEGQIYIAFNSTMLNFFDWIASKIPDQKSDYMLMKSMFKGDITSDNKRPLKLFRTAIQGHEHCLAEFTDDNLTYFLQTAPKIKLLAELKIGENYKKLSRPDWIELWAFLKTLKDFSILPDFIPEDLMNRLEKLVGGLTQQKDWQELAPKFVADPKGNFKEAFSKMLKNVKGDNGMMEGLKKLEKEIASKSKLVDPDTSNPFSQKYQQFDQHVQTEISATSSQTMPVGPSSPPQSSSSEK
jgi:hypothetical protein